MKENRLTHNEMIILKLRAGGHDYNMIAKESNLIFDTRNIYKELKGNYREKIWKL